MIWFMADIFAIEREEWESGRFSGWWLGNSMGPLAALLERKFEILVCIGGGVRRKKLRGRSLDLQEEGAQRNGQNLYQSEYIPPALDYFGYCCYMSLSLLHPCSSPLSDHR